MLDEIGSKDHVPAYIKRVKEGEIKLMGFGHRIYKNYDPRAKIIRWSAEQVFEVTGRSPKLDIALELERIALEDDYFVKRKLYPNVDFYSGIMYQAMGFRPEMFTVLFAIPRTAGWLAQWQELITDPEQKIARPRQIYTGYARAGICADRQADSGANSGGFSVTLNFPTSAEEAWKLSASPHGEAVLICADCVSNRGISVRTPRCSRRAQGIKAWLFLRARSRL